MISCFFQFGFQKSGFKIVRGKTLKRKPTMTRTPSESDEDLRIRVEEKSCEGRTSTSEKVPPEAVDQLLLELRTHQIELERQNEELRLAQQKLEALQSHYYDLYNRAPVGYLTLNQQGLIVEANLFIANLLGVTRNVLINQPFSLFVLSEDQDVYYQQCKHPADKNTSDEGVICDLRMVCTDGTLFWAHLQLASSFGIDDEYERRIVVTDITKQKLAEIEVLTSRRHWKKTFNAMNDIVTIQDQDRRIIRANKAAQQFFQVKHGELRGKHCYEIFTGESHPCAGCPMDETFKGEGRNSAVIKHDILGRIFQVSTALMDGENEDERYFIHVAKDITDQKKLEEDLFQAHKMEAIGTLAGGIAHDFNNILSAILGFSELAKLDLPEDSTARADIDQVISSSNRATELVSQILTFSRKTDKQQHPFQPHLIVKEALQMLRATLPATISIETNIDSESGSILSDPTSVHQIMVNLCANACHAMENEKGTITVNLSRKQLRKEDNIESDVSPGVFMELSVQDTGRGMDEKTMARIFEPYFTTNETGGGSGLGLSVVHGIVKALHGFIKVESKLGKGSTFHVYIPALEKTAPMFVKNEVSSLNDVARGTERILFVDDENIIVKLNKSALEFLGYKVTGMTNSLEALAEFSAHADEYDLLITDQTMPDLSGVELSQEIQKIKPDLPIILCTGYSSILPEEKALSFGVKRYVLKPVTMRTISKIAREVLDGK
jgi:two-component system, cell cycle sensor histidine kinase and response regulator CckA